MLMPDTLGTVGVVQIGSVTPPVSVSGDLWFNTATNTLMLSNNGAWVPAGAGGAGGAPEVHVGTAAPTGSELIWIDTSTNPISVNYLVAGAWNPGLDAGRY